MGKEKTVINEILLNLPKNMRLFRINAGLGWTGKKYRDTKAYLILKDPRPFRAAPKGWPDLCGWESVEITKDMVGQKIARFTGIEVKATGKLTKEQKIFKQLLEKMGGKYRVEK